MTNTKNISKGLGLSIGLAFGILAVNSTTAHADTQVTVQTNDTVWAISKRFNTSIAAIENTNNINRQTHIILLGQKLVIPTSYTTTKVSGNTNTTNKNRVYTVKKYSTVKSTQRTYKGSTYTGLKRSTTTTTNNSGSVYSQFINAGGTATLWSSIVMPESGGNPNAVNGQYQGLGQTNQSWGTGSVATQTKGMINYAISRYGSINNAIAFRQAHNWW